jgi:lysyl-tRNA synthetase, class II
MTELINAEEEYQKNRLSILAAKKESGIQPYPHKFNVSEEIITLINKYSTTIKAGERLKDNKYSIAGRVYEIRNSKNIMFLTIKSNQHSIQIIIDKTENDIPSGKEVCRGDIIGIIGYIGKSLKGELSLYAMDIIILTPSLKFLSKNGLKDHDLRARKRYLDLITNQDTAINPFIIRSNVFKDIRNYLDNMNFLEVHTPILWGESGGAIAKPFKTFHNDAKQDMFMRIAPELFLKKLVVGGIDRVYELGPQFRNEGCDRTHNAEFYSLEFYMAYADYYDMMKIGEEMIKKIVSRVHPDLMVPYGNKILDFSKPFAKIDIYERLLGIIPNFHNILVNSDCHALNEYCIATNIPCSEPRTMMRLLDKLIGYYIEPECVNPTLLFNHPIIMSPLAKGHRDNPVLSERFEIFVNGMELANSYTELNDPVVQRSRFELQLADKANGDDEAQLVDETFIDALQYGLPPVAGFGMGIERLVMFLGNLETIRDVIAFPLMG